MSEQLDRLENKMDKLHTVVCTYIQETEKRVTRLETIQRGLLWFFGTATPLCVGYLLATM